MAGSEGFTAVLTIAYLLVFLTVSFQIFRIVKYKHDIRSFQANFLWLCWLWTALRVVYWMFFWAAPEGLLSWPCWCFNMVFRLPNLLEFSTYALLVLFFAHWIYNGDEGYERLRLAYGILNAVLVVLLMVWILVDDLEYRCGWSNRAGQAYKIFSGSVFLVLTSLLYYYGRKLNELLQDPENKLTPLVFDLREQSRPRLLWAKNIIIAIFIARSLYDYVSVIGSLSISIVAKNSKINWIVFVFYVVWEIVPTTMILFFSSPPKNNKSMRLLGRSEGSSNSTPAAEEEHRESAASHGPSQKAVFCNPNRYDSDEEERRITSRIMEKFAKTPDPYAPMDIHSAGSSRDTVQKEYIGAP